MSNRLDSDMVFMLTAAIMAQRATCHRGKVGAVLVRDRRIISIGYNGPPSGMPHCIDVGCEIDENTGGCLRSIHAEANAILWAGRQGVATEGATLYTTDHPCLYCARIIHSAGITRVVYAREYRDGQRGRYLIESEPLELKPFTHPFLGYAGDDCLLCGRVYMAHS